LLHGGDIKDLNEPKAAQCAIHDAFLIVRNLIRLEKGEALYQRGQSNSPKVTQYLQTAFSTGLKSGIMIYPLFNSMRIVMKTSLAVGIKSDIQAIVMNLMYDLKIVVDK